MPASYGYLEAEDRLSATTICPFCKQGLKLLNIISKKKKKKRNAYFTLPLPVFGLSGRLCPQISEEKEPTGVVHQGALVQSPNVADWGSWGPLLLTQWHFKDWVRVGAVLFH